MENTLPKKVEQGIAVTKKQIEVYTNFISVLEKMNKVILSFQGKRLDKRFMAALEALNDENGTFIKRERGIEYYQYYNREVFVSESTIEYVQCNTMTIRINLDENGKILETENIEDRKNSYMRSIAEMKYSIENAQAAIDELEAIKEAVKSYRDKYNPYFLDAAGLNFYIR